MLDLWLVSCFLLPFLRDMNFWKNPLEREEYKVRAKSLVRTMSCVSTNDGNVVNCSGSESQPITDNSEFAQSHH